MEISKKEVKLFFCGLLLSGVIGTISFLFLIIEGFTTSLMWEKIPQLFGGRTTIYVFLLV